MPFIQETFPIPPVNVEQQIRVLRSVVDVTGAIHVVGVAVAVGGSGYAVGDVVELTGAGSGTPFVDGTAVVSFDARFIVTAEAAGVVTGIALESAGGYSTAPDPTSAGIATTAIIGAGDNALTLTVTVLGPYEAIPESGLEGTGFAVGDLFAVDGFTGATDPQFRVLAVAAGAVISTVQHLLGTFAFDEIPLASSPTTIISGAGSGLEVNANQIGWQTQRRDDVDDETEFEWITKGTNLAGGDPVIGIRAFLGGGSGQWNLMGATGFDDLAAWHQQPGISPTFGSGAFPLSSGGALTDCRMPLSTGGTFEIFISVTPRRLVVVARRTPSYHMLYLGLFTPFVDDPANRFPRPMIVAGTTARDSEDITDTYVAGTLGPASLPHHGGGNSKIWNIRWIDGTWPGFGISSFDDYKLWPYFSSISSIDNLADSCINPAGGVFLGNQQNGPTGGPVGDQILNALSVSAGFSPLPFGVGNQTHPLIPYTIIQDITGSGVSQVAGELEGVLHINAENLSGEDRVQLPNGDVAVVFPNINSTANNRFWALLET